MGTTILSLSTAVDLYGCVDMRLRASDLERARLKRKSNAKFARDYELSRAKAVLLIASGLSDVEVVAGSGLALASVCHLRRCAGSLIDRGRPLPGRVADAETEREKRKAARAATIAAKKASRAVVRQAKDDRLNKVAVLIRSGLSNKQIVEKTKCGNHVPGLVRTRLGLPKWTPS